MAINWNTEGNPAKTGRYIVTVKRIWPDWSVTKRVEICSYDGYKQIWSLNGYEIVTAWAELPEAYEGGENDGV